jgi:hypothetical protein
MCYERYGKPKYIYPKDLPNKLNGDGGKINFERGPI